MWDSFSVLWDVKYSQLNKRRDNCFTWFDRFNIEPFTHSRWYSTRRKQAVNLEMKSFYKVKKYPRPFDWKFRMKCNIRDRVLK
jgi:hypothetical protein